MSLINTPLLMAGGGYEITRSVRLRSSASAFFNRTPASAGNRRVMTFSWWMKLGQATGSVFGAPSTTNPRMQIYYNGPSDGRFELYMSNGAGSQVCYTLTSSRYRDPSAWYHFVIEIDTTQATASNRIKWYVNGVQLTAFDTAAYPSQNTDMEWNAAVVHNIGRQPNGGSYFDGYLAEINFIDGQALTPSSFGFIDPSTGVWGPRKYTGTYGTNGFYLNFTDNSAATATTIGKDYSGNGNNWTPNNISVTAGVTYDSMIDSPTQFNDGGNGRGNYAVFDAVSRYRSAPLDGNLRWNGSSTSSGSAPFGLGRAVDFPMLTGKWYWEITPQAGSSQLIGIAAAASVFGVASEEAGLDGTANSYFYLTGGGAWFGTTFISGWGASYTTGDVISVAYDADAGRLYFAKNGTYQASGNPSGGTNGQSIPASPQGQGWTPYVSSSTYTGNSYALNAGQRPFSYTPPTGFRALNTQNLPQPTIPNGASYMAATLYTGTGAAQTISNAVNGVSFQPDFVWAKARSSAESHRLQDSVRGATLSLYSNLTNAETTEAQSITAFGSGGFTLGTGTPNTNAVTYVGWQWKAGGTPAVTNTNGSITSTVSANTTAGFSIVRYTGNGTNGATIGHGLGVAPAMTIVKDRSNGTNGWPVWQRSFAGTQTLYLDSTTGLLTRDRVTAVSSTTFTVSSHTEVNNNGNSYIAYVFAAVAGYSAFGSYTGNGSADGTFVFCGFRPRWVMIKRTDASNNWNMLDAARDLYNPEGNVLYADQPNAEATDANLKADFLSNGFKLRGTWAGLNASSGTYIYAAFAENPFKFALAR
jgi:hypothetical protein